jgi:hypothetical protein
MIRLSDWMAGGRMLQLVGGQVESLFDELLPVEVRELPADLARRQPGNWRPAGGCGGSSLTPGRAGWSRGHGSGVPPSAQRHPPGEGAKVCLAVGCSSLGIFSSRFTDLVGMPPSTYRHQATRATAGMPSCVAKQVTSPVRNREAPLREAH